MTLHGLLYSLLTNLHHHCMPLPSDHHHLEYAHGSYAFSLSRYFPHLLLKLSLGCSNPALNLICAVLVKGLDFQALKT